MSDANPLASPLSRTVFGVHGEALGLRQQRLQTIASNLANADTPHYLARDIDFASALRAATAPAPAAPGSAGAGPAQSAPGHLPGLSALAQQFQVYRVPTQPSLDGNTVDANVEHAAFARAAMEYRASLGFIQGRLGTLRTAITGE